MDFEDGAEEAAFRAEARRWIRANAPKYLEEHLLKSTFGIIETGPFDLFAESKKWMKRKADAGWSCIHWPREFGGRGGRLIESLIWTEEEGIFSKLNDLFLLGHGMCGPTLLAFGTPEQKRKYLPRLISGDDYWCQMFSEPQGGSDLAGLRSRAVRDGDGWILRGQKIWTSGAQFAQYGIVIARTDPNVPKHMGLTMFVLDLRAAGVTVRPIRQANGLQEFNEVFFDDARIPDSDRVGDDLRWAASSTRALRISWLICAAWTWRTARRFGIPRCGPGSRNGMSGQTGCATERREPPARYPVIKRLALKARSRSSWPEARCRRSRNLRWISKGWRAR
jgi:alkylation response protein AidB-like acyl-CoA dehydrogenase